MQGVLWACMHTPAKILYRSGYAHLLKSLYRRALFFEGCKFRGFLGLPQNLFHQKLTETHRV